MSTPEPEADRSRERTRDIEAVLGIGAQRRWGVARVTKWLVIIVAALAVTSGATYWLLGGSQPAMSYVTEPVTNGTLTVIVTATGSVQPTNKVDISTELSGTVREVLVDYNSPVTPGQVLAELDTDRLEATVASSRARVAAAEARVAETAATIEEKQGDYERKQQLAEQKVTSVQDLAVSKAAYDRAVAAHAHALAEVNVAKADLDLNETNLAKTCICSPITGVVLERNVDPGQTVAASLQAPVLFTIAEDLKQMELQVDVDEADVGRTVIGQEATFSVDAYPGRRFPAEIRDIRISPETVQGVVTYKAMLIIDNSELLLRPGMTATAEIVVRKVEDGLLVPNAALRFTPSPDAEDTQTVSLLQRIIPSPPRFRPASRPAEDGPDRTIWVLRDGVPVAVPIVVGASDGRSTEIVEGDITSGDRVIIDTR
jgi:HlyD family secretion protein